jgi:CBS domain-containing protein
VRVGQMCNRTVVVTDAAAGLFEAAQLMREHHVGTLVVVARGDAGVRPVGILTDRDIVVEAVAEAVPLDRIAVGDIMSAEIVTAKEDDDLSDTMDRMRSQGVRRMPVVDSGGDLVGILALDDVMELLSDMIGRMSQVSERQRRLEKSGRPWPPHRDSEQPTLTQI